MTGTNGGFGRNAFYLDATARESGWRIAWEPEGSVMTVSKSGSTVMVYFDAGGMFSSARAIGPGSSVTNLTLQQTIDTLEHRASK